MFDPVGKMFGMYIDLSGPRDAPLHCFAPELTYHMLEADDSITPSMQRLLPQSFRTELAISFPHLNIAISDPREVEPDSRSDRWLMICELLDEFPGLALLQRIRLLGVLVSLGFHKLVNDLAIAFPALPSNDSEANLRYRYIIASARYAMFCDGEIFNYDLREFADIAFEANAGTRLAVNAQLHMVVQNARHTNDLSETVRWSQAVQESMRLAERHLSEFEAHLLWSRLYRATSFVPFMQGDRAGCVEVMDRAESHARKLNEIEKNFFEELLCRENWIPLLQSRSKEARFTDDLSLALERLNRNCQLDPLDALRWLELGECQRDLGSLEDATDSFQMAISLSPPGGAYACFALGQTREGLETFDEALQDYLDCIAIDPLCVSAYERIASIAPDLGHMNLASWAEQELQRLSSTEL